MDLLQCPGGLLLIIEECQQGSESLGFPFTDLTRMNIVSGRDLGKCLPFF